MSSRQIPPSKPSEPAGRNSICQLKAARPSLQQSEADAFLAYMFSDVTRRPQPLTLREGARVARYLKALACETEPGPLRQLLDRLGDVIWGHLLQFAPLELGSKQEALRFLEEHSDTYLATFNVKAAIECVRDSAPPAQHEGYFPPPLHMSRSRATSGMGDPRLREDLTERIYVGYHALMRTGLRNVRRKLAEALNEQGLETRARKETLTLWGSYEVYERVKQYERKLRDRFLAGSKECTLKEMREMLVDAWILCFRPGVGEAQGADGFVSGSPTSSSPRDLAGTAVPEAGGPEPMRATGRLRQPR